MRSATIAVLLGSLAAAGIGGAPGAAADEKPIIIGFATAQTGFVVPYDNGVKTAEMAIEDINAKGGLLGRKLVSIYSDTKSDRVRGAKAGLDVIQRGADLVVVTCDFDFGGPAAMEAQKAGKLTFSLCAGDAKFGVQGIGPLAFTPNAAAPLAGAALAEWAYKKKGIRTPFVLLDSTAEFNKSVCFGFDTAWKAMTGSEPAGRDTFRNADPSIASQVTRVRNASPAADAVVLCSYQPGGASAVRQIRASGISTPILSTMAMDGKSWLDGVPNLSEFYIPVMTSVHGDDPDPKVNDFIKRYAAKYGAPPPEAQTLEGYVLMQLYAGAVETAKSTDGAAVAKALESNAFETILGRYAYTPQSHIQTKYQFTILSVQGGKHQSVEKWTPETPMSMNMLIRRVAD